MASWFRASGVILIGLVLLAAAGALLFPYTAPIVVAILMAVLVDPLVERIDGRLRWGRGRAVLLIVAAATLLSVLLGLLLINHLSHELSRLLTRLPEMGRMAQDWTADTLLALDAFLSRLPPPLQEAVRRAIVALADMALREAQGLLPVLKVLPQGLFLLLVSGVTSYFLVRDKHIFAGSLMAVLPREGRRTMRYMMHRLAGGAVGFVRAQLVLMMVTTVMTVAAFNALRIPYPWLLGLLAGLLDLVPLLGPGLVLIPLIAAYLALDYTPTALGLLLLWGMVIMLRQVIEPRLLGRQMDLHPVTTILSMYLAVQAIGVGGFIIGPLAAVCLKAAFVALSSEK